MLASKKNIVMTAATVFPDKRSRMKALPDKKYRKKKVRTLERNPKQLESPITTIKDVVQTPIKFQKYSMDSTVVGPKMKRSMRMAKWKYERVKPVKTSRYNP